MPLPLHPVPPSLVLRPALSEDAALLARWWADGALMAWVGFPRGLTTDVKALRIRLEAQTPEEVLWILEFEGRPVGEAYHRLTGSEAEVGMKIWSPENRGIGWGRAALGRLLVHLCTFPTVDHVTLDTWEHNGPARRCYEALGFQNLGPLPPWTDQEGAARTAIEYRLNRPARIR